MKATKFLIHVPFFSAFVLAPLRGTLEYLDIIAIKQSLIASVDILYCVTLAILYFGLKKYTKFRRGMNYENFFLVLSILSFASLLVEFISLGYDSVNFSSLSQFKLCIYSITVYFYIQLFSLGRLIPILYRYSLALCFFVILSFFAIYIFEGTFGVPHVSGDRNYDAALLVIVSIVYLAGFTTKHSYYYNFPGGKLGVSFLYLCLFLCLSRTASASVLISSFMLLKNKISLKKVILLIVIAIIIFSSFVYSVNVRGLSFDIQSQDRFFMFLTYFDFFNDSPLSALSPRFQSIPLTSTPLSRLLWLSESQNISADLAPGMYPFNLHAFVLRFVSHFGLIVSSFLMIVYFSILKNILAVRKDLSLFWSYILFFVVNSLTLGLLYVQNMYFVVSIVPIILSSQISHGFGLTTRQALRSTNTYRQNPL